MTKPTARPRRTTRLGTLCVALVIVLSLVFVTTARRAAMTAFAPTELEFASYLAAGGSLDALCTDAGIPHPGSAACDACRLIDLVALPDGIATRSAFWIVARPWVAPRVKGLTATPFVNPAAPARGPPMTA